MVELVDTLRLERSAYGVGVRVPLSAVFSLEIYNNFCILLHIVLFQGSSVVEQAAVNRWVVGSSPTLGEWFCFMFIVLMPITSSAKKALKRDLVLTERNAYFKTAMKRAVKALRKGISAKVEKTELHALLVQAYQAIDKAAKRNIVHKNNAARKKSRLTSAVNSVA